MIESQLITRCQQHDNEAQRIVYERYAGKMLGVCLRYAANRAEAEDLLHDGFVTAFGKVKQFKNKGSFEGWLQRIMVNTALMHLRSKSKEQGRVPFEEIEWQIADEQEDEAYSESAIQTVQKASFTKEEILEQVASLPEGFRVVFNLYAIEQMKHKEIAKTLGISTGTSKSQLFHARKQIQKALYHKAVEQKKEKENKKRAIVAILTGMGLGLDHIDVLAQEAATGLSVPTTGGWEALQQSLASGQAATGAASASAGASIATKAVITIAAAGAIATTAYFISESSTKDEVPANEITAPAPESTPEPEKTFSIPVAPVDSICKDDMEPVETPEKTIAKPLKEETKTEKTIVYDTVRVPVKKVIRVKKQRLVRDTVHKQDTLHIK